MSNTNTTSSSSSNSSNSSASNHSSFDGMPQTVSQILEMLAFFASLLCSWLKLFCVFFTSVCRPPRRSYKLDDLGPEEFLLDGTMFTRTEFEVPSRGVTLQCRHVLSSLFS